MMNSTEKDEEMPELELIEKRVMPLLPKTGIVVASVSIKKPNRKRPVQVPVEKPEEIILDKGPLSDNFKVICPCKIEQRINYPPTALCRGAEFIDGEIKICAEKATGKKAFRSSHLVTFFIPLCQECTLEMHSHYFCPACGFKCKNSNFIECEDGHRFHKLCAELLPDADSKCPHCEKEISERSKRPVFKIEPKIAKRDFNINLPRRIGTIQNNFKFNDEENGFLCEMVNALYKSVTGLKNVTKQKISAAEVSRAIDKNDFQNLAKFIVTGCLNTRIEGLTLFHYAIRKNKFYLAEVFQRLGVDPSLGHIETNRNALMEAIEKNALKTVQFCILSKTDSSIKDMTGKSALHYAAKTACREIVELLLENSARIIIGDQDYTGFSALHWAIEGASLEILILILRFSSPEDLIKCDQQSKTALHWAAHYGKARFCEKLLEFDSKLIDIQDSEGKTAMHYAAMANSEATIISLAKFTPDLSKKDKTAKFARDYTKGSNNLLIKVIESKFEIDNKRPSLPKRRQLLADITMGKENIGIPVINSVDDTPAPVNFKYISKSVPRESSIKIIDEIEDCSSCTCKDSCTLLNCDCQLNSEIGVYLPNGRLNMELISRKESVILHECNDLCSCEIRICKNRNIQKGLPFRLEVFRTEKFGWGVRSSQPIYPGQFVAEFIGEICKFDQENAVNLDYIFELYELSDEKYCLDSSNYGNISRFINHSCDPNLIPVRVSYDNNDFRFPNIAFFATKLIEPYQELTFDYGDIFWSIRGGKTYCSCDNSKCRFKSHEDCRIQAEKIKRLNLY